ncbi:vomeronasal type-2 receptor 26-like [Pseudophryne corroboree]|uniref:vomeronasal type-2 receptor 26-like n=1 Tax=Pseudophryne corroboree TaxID=495146 RepID=UPI003081C85F
MELQRVMSQNRICIEYSIIIIENYPISNLETFNIISHSSSNVVILCSSSENYNLLSFLEDFPNLRKVFILFGTFQFHKVRTTFALNGSLLIHFHKGEIPGLKDFLLSVSPESYPKNNILHYFWKDNFGCLPNMLENVKEFQAPPCNETYSLRAVSPSLYDVDNFRYTFSFYSAVYSLAHALQAMYSHGSGQGVEKRVAWQINRYLKNIRFTTPGGEEIRFDNGDIPAKFDLLNVIFLPDKSLQKKHVRHIYGDGQDYQLQMKSSSAISSELAETSGTQVLPSTVQGSLARSALHGRTADKRYTFSVESRPSTSTMQENIGTGAEKHDCNRRQFVHQKALQRCNNECLLATVKHGGGFLQVWGCISTYEVMDLDNDLKHTANVIKNYLQHKVEKGVLEVETPRSVCTESCFPGYQKSQDRPRQSCCHYCVRCPEGEISNTTDMEICLKCPEHQWSNDRRDACIERTVEFLSHGEILGASLISIALLFCCLTAVILGIFIKYRDTAVVRANNQNLSFSLLLSLILAFLCPLIFIGRPTEMSCLLRQVAFGNIFTLALSSLLAKTVTVVLAFRATKPDQKLMRWLTRHSSRLLLVIYSFGEAVICALWLCLSPPFPDYDTQAEVGKMILQCNEGSVAAFYIVIGYMGGLAALCFIVASLARKLPDTFNEAQYITFSMAVFCSVWVAFIPAYLSAKGKYTVAFEVFAILASSAGLLGCIFIPKCYIILIRPDLNIRANLISRRI